MPFGVEHVDRIIRDALDEQAETLFARAKLFLCRPAVGQIARDLRETYELARGIADRIDHDVRPESAAILADAPAFGLKSALAFGCFQRDPGDLLLLAPRECRSGRNARR